MGSFLPFVVKKYPSSLRDQLFFPDNVEESIIRVFTHSQTFKWEKGVTHHGGNMKKIMSVIIVVLILVAACIGQEEEKQTGEKKESAEWTVEDWKNHLSLMDPTLTQDASTMLPVFRNPDNLSVGTKLTYDLTMEGTVLGMDFPMTSVMDITFSGKETIKGVDCFMIDIISSVTMTTQDMTMNMEMVGTEWIDDTTGALVIAVMEMEAKMEGEEAPLPLSLTIERVGEELYHGHDCWILELKQEMGIEDVDLGEIKILQYVDKADGDVVRQIMTFGEQEMDSGYIEPPPGGAEWELGPVETITTDLGTYECQVINVIQNGETVGTIWASKEFTTPLKYVMSVSQGGSTITMTMVLTAYELG
jgi:hypothetical protein